ncbi:MAG: FMN-binding negative transcriptional regulator [Burkholderiales bacterium]|nr:FMN-binding negative transcriptional regulator [Burkholderiales bacterium]
MYQPSHFAQHEPAALQALMHEHPLAVLVTLQDGLPTADHIPLEFDPASNALRGHVARANPLWRAAQGQPVLAVFTGPQAYVSPSWYPSKAATHKVVPTWNYTVVHAQGVLRAVDDAPWLHALVSRLTAHHERPQARPWAVADAPDDYVQQMLRAIVGIEIAVTTLVGKWKLSQNRSAGDRAGVVAGLQQGDAQARATAALMQDAASPAP